MLASSLVTSRSMTAGGIGLGSNDGAPNRHRKIVQAGLGEGEKGGCAEL
jgi:hypothetical protein